MDANLFEPQWWLIARGYRDHRWECPAVRTGSPHMDPEDRGEAQVVFESVYKGLKAVRFNHRGEAEGWQLAEEWMTEMRETLSEPYPRGRCKTADNVFEAALDGFKRWGGNLKAIHSTWWEVYPRAAGMFSRSRR